ncbi:MAG: c-type cytochrome [Verrucomicrobia bacterium]|nr:c-type cytochrome [Verrucomicrobiota bacterium]
MLKRLLFLLALAGTTINAQQGDGKDAPGEVQVSRVPAEMIPPSPVLSSAEALKSFTLQPGFRIELVADEPLVRDPVAMAFDADGRIWVAEMSGYMQTYEGGGEDQPVGNIVVLEDTNGDGKMDKRTVFLDNLVMPRAVSLVRGGVLVAEPPNLWFCRDTNGDLKCDEKTLVATDYGDTKNPEHTANGLLWALDNYIYSADTTIRFKSLPNGEWQRDATAFRGQWGLAQDDFGRLVYNSNADQFRMDFVPSHYLKRNPNLRDAKGLNIDPIRNQITWPIRVTPGVNRGYREGILRPDGTLEKFTAACGPLIYRGDHFPSDFYGNAFVCEPAAHLIKRNVLVEENGIMRGWQAYTNAEFLASTDERFRPVNLNNGPDGALYIVDMYRGVLQHKIFLTSYLRKQSEARDLEKPVGLGRIYRVVHEGKPLSKVPQLSKATSPELVKQLSNGNGAIRDVAQRLLVERNDRTSVAGLRQLALEGKEPLGRLHALWALEGMKRLDSDFLLQALNDSHLKVKATAIRLLEPFLTTDAKDKLLIALRKEIDTDSHDVRMQLAFTLGEVKDAKAEAGMLILAKNVGNNIYLRDALVTGLHQRELAFIEKLLGEKGFETKHNGNDVLLGALAQCVVVEAKPKQVERLLTLTAEALSWQQIALLNGMAAAIPPPPKGKTQSNIKPILFSGEPASWKQLSAIEEKQTVALVTKLNPLIVWSGKAGYVAQVAAKPLTTEEQQRFDTGKELYAITCGACHQPTGLGMEGLAPPLVNSDWVLGSSERLALIVLHGVKGPITVNGKLWDMEMPGLPFFDDEQIASIITYMRREWEHAGEPVSPETVKKVREAAGDRAEAWTEVELLKLP